MDRLVNMLSKNLTDLAPELIIQILKSSDDFADLTSLGSASRKLFIIWKTNDNAICETVLARSVPCYKQIQEQLQVLLDVQATRGPAESEEYSGFGFRSASDRAKRIVREADTAAKALVYFEDSICKLWVAIKFPVERALLTSAERTDFVRAYHRAVTLVTIRDNRLPYPLFTTWSNLDLKQVGDVMVWLKYFCPCDQLQKLVLWLDYRNLDHNIAGIIDSEYWNPISDCVFKLGMILLPLTSERDEDAVKLAPYFPSIVRNHYQDQYRSNRGACIGDLIALAKKQDSYYDIAWKALQRVSSVDAWKQDARQ